MLSDRFCEAAFFTAEAQWRKGIANVLVPLDLCNFCVFAPPR